MLADSIPFTAEVVLDWRVLIFAGAVAVAALANPDTIEDGAVICPFRRMTGLPCPGCGLTRSWVYLVHGQWSDAVTANPFGVVLFGLCLAFAVVTVVALVRRKPPIDLGKVLRSRWFYGFAAVWVLFGIVRLIDVAVTR
jgi:hypothetical protein